MKKSVPSGQKVAFQPALAGVLRENFENAPVAAEVDILRQNRFHPGAFGHLEHILKPVGGGFIGPNNAEVALRLIGLEYRAQEITHRSRRFRFDGSRSCNRHCVRSEVRQLEIFAKNAAIGMRIGAHAEHAAGSARANLWRRGASSVE
jgi:hypothetical protein